MRAYRLLLISVGMLSLSLSTAPVHAGEIHYGLNIDLVLDEGDSLVLQGYDTVLVLVENGTLTGDILSFNSGGSIDFWGPDILNPPFIPVDSIMGKSLEFCTYSTPCGPFPGDLGFYTVVLPSNVGDILIEAASQIIFKGLPGNPTPAVPEPKTALLLGSALVAFGIQRRTLRFR